MLDTYEQNSKKKLVATVLAVIVIAGVVVLADVLKSKDSTTASQGTSQTVATSTEETDTDTAATGESGTSTSTDSTSAAMSSSSGVKDGSFSASANYFVPHGTESIQVSLTLSGGTVTDVSIVNSEGDHESAEWQAEFTSSYKSFVVGKKISGLQISTVAGASDTTDGFNEALAKIANEAQA